MDPSKPPPSPPTGITRAALERVLARAAELQAASGDETEPDALTEAQVVDLGREVGLSTAALRQALAEERSRLVPVAATESGLVTQVLGGARVGAQRVVRGTPARVLDTLDRWMQRDELLRTVRQRADMLVWEPTRGIIGNLRRAFGNRDYALFRANHIAATAVAVDEGSSLVRLEADFSRLRTAIVTQSLSGGVIGGAFTAAAVVANVVLPLAVIPVLGVPIAAYLGSRRVHRHAMGRALLTLEQLLDRLERGETQTPSLLRMIESALPPLSSFPSSRPPGPSGPPGSSR